MKTIELLMDHIEDELDDACTYAKLALEYKSTDPEMATLFYKLSGEEMQHMNALHNSVMNHIDAYKRTHGEAPEAMRAVYDHLHKRHIDRAERIGVLQSMFQGK